MTKEQNSIAEWGGTAAIVLLGIAMLGAVALILYGAWLGDGGGMIAPALLVLIVGAAAAVAVLALQKRAERAARPAWMGHTTEWREEMRDRIEGHRQPGAGKPEPPATG